MPLRQRVTDLRKVGCSGVKRRHGHRRVSQRAYRKVNTYVIVPSWTAGAEAETLNLALRAAFLAASQRVASWTVVPRAPGTALVTVPYWST